MSKTGIEKFLFLVCIGLGCPIVVVLVMWHGHEDRTFAPLGWVAAIGIFWALAWMAWLAKLRKMRKLNQQP
jgi:uncharacterized membrane protein